MPYLHVVSQYRTPRGIISSSYAEYLFFHCSNTACLA